MKTSITKTDRLALLGLLTIASQHNAKLQDTVDAVTELLGAEKDDEHCMDAVYDTGRCDPDALLKRLNITVQKK